MKKLQQNMSMCNVCMCMHVYLPCGLPCYP